MEQIKGVLNKKQKRHLGSVNLYSDQLPGAENYKIGDKVQIIVEIEVDRLSKVGDWEFREYGIPKGTVEVGNRILSIKPATKPKVEKKTNGTVPFQVK